MTQNNNDNTTASGDTLGILSLIFGILCFFVFGVPLGVAAVVCGLIAASRGSGKGVAGAALGAIGALITLIGIMAIMSMEAQ